MSQQAALAVAQTWATRGIPAFPIILEYDEQKQGLNKRPATTHGHRDATVDLEQLEQLYTAASQRLRDGEALGTGLHTGPAGIIVIDVDKKNSKNGYIAAEHLGLLDSYGVSTPSGGQHRYYTKTTSERVSNYSPWAEEGIDIRADDGWVVAPGTKTEWGDWAKLDDHAWAAGLKKLPSEIHARLRPSPEQKAGSEYVASYLALDKTTLAALPPATRDMLAHLTDQHGAHHPIVRSTPDREPWVEVCRPGKQRGISATIGAIAPGILHVFSSDWDRLPADNYICVDEQLRSIEAHDRMLEERWAAHIASQVEQIEQNGPQLRSTLALADLAAYIGRDVQPEQPSLLARTDDQHLLYAGRYNEIHGEAGIGKTWVLYAALAQHLDAGGTAIILDYEDTAVGFWLRCRTLGIPEEILADPTRVSYINPTIGLKNAELEHLEQLISMHQEHGPVLLAIDTLAPALALDSADENSNADVTLWNQQRIRRLLSSGCTILALDHVTKDAALRNRGARGASAKLALIDGASYHLTVIKSFSQHEPGELKLTVAKDRHGGVGGIGTTAATIRITPTSEGLAVAVAQPTLDTAGRDQPTQIMAAISDWLQNHDQLEVGQPAIIEAIGARKTTIRRALDELERGGHVIAKISSDRGRALTYRLIEPYAETF